MIPSNVNVQEINERRITFKVGCDENDLEQVGKFLVNAGQDGYTLKSIGTMEGGNQRDPRTVGVHLTLMKTT